MKFSPIPSKFTAAKWITLLTLCLAMTSCKWLSSNELRPFSGVATLSGINREFGEPFGVAIRNNEVFVSDGEKGSIWRVSPDGAATLFAKNFDTPSHIAFDANGDLIVADSGSHTIKKVKPNGDVEIIAGKANRRGFRDGELKNALFNAPVGLAVQNKRIYVADTYNDRIRVIENGVVSTLSGSRRGFSDSNSGINAKFDTPTGLGVWSDGRILVADSGNRRIRVVEQDGNTWTLAGTGRRRQLDGDLAGAVFVNPTAIAVSQSGIIFIADGNSIRTIGRRTFPLVETISGSKRGFLDGDYRRSRFNRPSGLGYDKSGNLYVADSENQFLRVFSGTGTGRKIGAPGFEKLQIKSDDFRKSGPPRWMYDPPSKPRDIAGTLGEIRGKLENRSSQAWFHNGLDVAGGYGEVARFIRDEKVLNPFSVQNFETTRELIRMPTIGYIHIRLGRDRNQTSFGDKRFQFEFGPDGKPVSLRVPRGAIFRAGEPIGTLNSFNHVHLITGRIGREMNALDSLSLPGVADSRIPKIENLRIFQENWSEIETTRDTNRIKVSGRVRIVVRAYDQMDGNAARRKLGLYKLGYQLFTENGKAARGFESPVWSIRFDKNPDPAAVNLVYAVGSQSGATGETIFNYIVTNKVSGKENREDFLDTNRLNAGVYRLRVFAADFFGNTASKDILLVKD